MNILIVSSCTSTKRKQHSEQLLLDDFRHPDPDHLQQRKQALRNIQDEHGAQVDLELEARMMYTGRQHEYVIEGVDRLRQALAGAAQVDLKIVSAGYGLVDERERILPYEATFNGLRKAELNQYAQQTLKLPSKVASAIEDYDLVFFLLGETYLQALDLFGLPARKGLVVVAGTATRKWFPRQHAQSLVPFTNDDVTTIGGGQIGLKGAILKRFAGILADIPEAPHRLDVLKELIVEPKRLRTMLRIPEQVRLPLPGVVKRKVVHINLPHTNRAKNSHGRPLFFVPDWDDLVNPDYQFDEDRHPQGQFDPYDHGAYAHQVLEGKPSYDGLLISRAVVDDSNEKKRSRFGDVHEFLRWNGPVMGDCGAFSYLNQASPPYSTDDVLAYYEKHHFNIGVSVDHLIVGDYAKDEAERSRRFRLTLDNADEFLRKHREGSFSFNPMGIAQGWDPESYRESVGALLEMGYEHIALGGLAFATSQAVVDILGRVSSIFPENLYVHLFGLAREELLEPYALYGVSAFDSATYLRRSWLSDRTNYLDHTTGDWYTAIRVPPSSFYVSTKKGPSLRLHKEVRRLLKSQANQEARDQVLRAVMAAEQKALYSLREFDKGSLSLPDTLKAVLEYDELVLPNRDLEALYERTLADQPWKRCDCPICRNLSIEVIIFRQNDRNRRRGFHNTYAFKRMEENVWQKMQHGSSCQGQ